MKRIVFISLLFLIVAVPLFYLSKSQVQVVSQKTQPTQTFISTSTPKPTVIPTKIPTKTPTPTLTLKKNSYAIALYGDSMIDTMYEHQNALLSYFKKKYPQVSFTVYNYGIGGENAEKGLSRFDNSFSNRERVYPPVSQIQADVFIIGTFAYNPFDPHDKNKHYLLLKQLLQKAKTVSGAVYLLAEIAPLKTGFGKGERGVNWPENVAYEHSLRIIEQLEGGIAAAKTEGVPIIDVYHLSQQEGQFGNPVYVNSGDGIHPSSEGHALTAETIAKTIRFN